jgi:hypothetical protein
LEGETVRTAVIKPTAIHHQCPETYPWPYDVVQFIQRHFLNYIGQVGKQLCLNYFDGCGWQYLWPVIRYYPQVFPEADENHKNSQEFNLDQT